jgi:hypothetical protein
MFFMKRIFMGAGALLLVSAGVFAGRSYKVADASTLYFTHGAGTCTTAPVDLTASAAFVTGATTATQAKIVTSLTTFKIYATSTCSSSSRVKFVNP